MKECEWSSDVFFFFKQKTAYEIKECDWSSDVCSSDLQEKGYAEADPTLDIEGIDSAHKIVILALLAFGSRVTLEDVYTEGISNITQTDIIYAREFGYRIKLLAKIGRASCRERV